MLINNVILEQSKKSKVIKEVMDGFFKRRIETQKQLDYFLYKSFELGSDITFNELKGNKIGMEYMFPVVKQRGNIHSKRVQTTEKDSILFETKFSKGATLTRHRHSDASEIITSQISDDPHEFVFTIVTGMERDCTMKEYVLHSGESLVIPANTTHQVSNASKKDAKLIVKFYKE